MRSLILQTTAPIVLHLTMIFSLYILLYGHDQPGGGFIAGIMTSIGIVLQWVAFGTKEALKRFNWKWDNVFMVGLLISTLTGLFGYFSNGFLKSSIYKINLVLIGEIKIFTAFIFDVGVYLVVVGVLMFIFTNFCSDKP